MTEWNAGMLEVISASNDEDFKEKVSAFVHESLPGATYDPVRIVTDIQYSMSRGTYGPFFTAFITYRLV